MDDECNDNEAQKPRRLDEDTVTYLSQLDVQLSSEDLDAEGREILVENVLSEIKLRTASAACDRRTNSVIEKLCYAASLPHLIEIINRCTPYAVFLARNRHSSHILQAILSRLCFILKTYGIGNVNEEELKKSVLGFLKLILNEISWLVKELSASHVVRSALCALAGIPIISERKVYTPSSLRHGSVSNYSSHLPISFLMKSCYHPTTLGERQQTPTFGLSIRAS